MSTSALLGPAPTRTDRPRAAALRVLRALVAAGEGVTLADLTGTLGGHPNTTRQQLEHLVGAGYATATRLPASGRGRPARAWAATVAGCQVAQEDAESEASAALVEAVAEEVAGGPDPAGMARAIGLGWGRRLAGSHPRLLPLLAAQGFTPEERGDVIALRSCPLLAAARKRPTVVCGIHQGLVDAVHPDAWIIEPFAVEGACLLRRCPSPRV